VLASIIMEYSITEKSSSSESILLFSTNCKYLIYIYMFRYLLLIFNLPYNLLNSAKMSAASFFFSLLSAALELRTKKPVALR